MDSKLPMHNKNITRNVENSTEVSRSRRQSNGFLNTDSSLEFEKLVKIWNGAIVRLLIIGWRQIK